MTTLQGGDLGLGKTLKVMCDKNDDKMVLRVLQLLGYVRKGGYMSVAEQVHSLSYCANRFAENNNKEFFHEFVEHMPDITMSDRGNPFSYLSRSYYFACKHADNFLNNLQTKCMMIDTDDLREWFTDYLISKRISNHSQLNQLYDSALALKDCTNDDFKVICNNYTIIPLMKTGQ